MTAKELHQLVSDQAEIKKWLERINEKDEAQINEVMDLMRTSHEYRAWILDYAKEAAWILDYAK